MPASPDVWRALEVIRRNVELEARLIDDLLDVTRIAKGKLQLSFEVVSVHEILQRAYEICSEDIATKQLQTEFRLRAVHAHVQGDPARLQQVFWNLIKNSVKFTPENGATYLLSGSHLRKEKPTDEEFFSQADRITGRSGSIFFWDSNIWHAAGLNKTDLPRRSLSLLYSQPFMKQQFDYPRSVGYENADLLPEAFKQIVGFNARVPASLEEWYQPPETRFYKKDQG